MWVDSKEIWKIMSTISLVLTSMGELRTIQIRRPKIYNNYVTRDRTNNASFSQKLDPIKNNILRRQNPLELVFEDISTFSAENPIQLGLY